MVLGDQNKLHLDASKSWSKNCKKS